MAFVCAARLSTWSRSCSFLTKNIKFGLVSARKSQIANVQDATVWLPRRTISLDTGRFSAENEIVESADANAEEGVNEETPKAKVDPSKDRSIKIPPETSIKYLESDAYKATYGDYPVWKSYRRNHKYAFPPKKTRISCIRKDVIFTGNPCPICRDEYLVLDYRNVKLLKQFISQYSDEVIGAYYTGLCQKKHFDLMVAVEKARDIGYIPFDVPKRQYSYDEYYPKTEENS